MDQSQQKNIVLTVSGSDSRNNPTKFSLSRGEATQALQPTQTTATQLERPQIENTSAMYQEQSSSQGNSSVRDNHNNNVQSDNNDKLQIAAVNQLEYLRNAFGVDKLIMKPTDLGTFHWDIFKWVYYWMSLCRDNQPIMNRLFKTFYGKDKAPFRPLPQQNTVYMVQLNKCPREVAYSLIAQMFGLLEVTNENNTSTANSYLSKEGFLGTNYSPDFDHKVYVPDIEKHAVYKQNNQHSIVAVIHIRPLKDTKNDHERSRQEKEELAVVMKQFYLVYQIFPRDQAQQIEYTQWFPTQRRQHLEWLPKLDDLHPRSLTRQALDSLIAQQSFPQIRNSRIKTVQNDVLYNQSLSVNNKNVNNRNLQYRNLNAQKAIEEEEEELVLDWDQLNAENKIDHQSFQMDYDSRSDYQNNDQYRRRSRSRSPLKKLSKMEEFYSRYDIKELSNQRFEKEEYVQKHEEDHREYMRQQRKINQQESLKRNEEIQQLQIDKQAKDSEIEYQKKQIISLRNQNEFLQATKESLESELMSLGTSKNHLESEVRRLQEKIAFDTDMHKVDEDLFQYQIEEYKDELKQEKEQVLAERQRAKAQFEQIEHLNTQIQSLQSSLAKKTSSNDVINKLQSNLDQNWNMNQFQQHMSLMFEQASGRFQNNQLRNQMTVQEVQAFADQLDKIQFGLFELQTTMEMDRNTLYGDLMNKLENTQTELSTTQIQLKRTGDELEHTSTQLSIEKQLNETIKNPTQKNFQYDEDLKIQRLLNTIQKQQELINRSHQTEKIAKSNSDLYFGMYILSKKYIGNQYNKNSDSWDFDLHQQLTNDLKMMRQQAWNQQRLQIKEEFIEEEEEEENTNNNQFHYPNRDGIIQVDD